MFRIRSFRKRLFLALLAAGLLPAAVAVGAGTLALRETVASSGTAGPWAQVAESGQELLDRVEDRELDPALDRAAQRHRRALSESVRFSRIYALLTDRVLRVLPLMALAVGVFTAVVALVMARGLTGSFSGPVQELVEWTRRIARDEPLPPPSEEGSGVREFDQLADALRTMASQLEEARRREVQNARLRSWTQMARRVAHEIKNPLTPMRMAAATVSRRDDPATAEAARVLTEEIARLDEMARSFSQLGKMPEGPTSDVDLRELLDGLARSHAGPEDRVEVEAPAGEPPMVRGHHDALQRVFRNLLVNALEAAEGEPGHVDVRLEPVAGAVRVRIQDRGPGIPDDALDRIWEPGYTTKRRGTGIGLPLVRQTIEAHGGEVEAGNAPHGGAEFVVILPREGPGPDPGSPSES